jgi:hypothetical protein
MHNAVENVRQRLLRAAGALQQAAVPYAVADGNAVAAWVSRVDEAAVRNTRDVDILLRRTDLDAARTALEQVGFVYRPCGTRNPRAPLLDDTGAGTSGPLTLSPIRGSMTRLSTVRLPTPGRFGAPDLRAR